MNQTNTRNYVFFFRTFSCFSFFFFQIFTNMEAPEIEKFKFKIIFWVFKQLFVKFDTIFMCLFGAKLFFKVLRNLKKKKKKILKFVNQKKILISNIIRNFFGDKMKFHKKFFKKKKFCIKKIVLWEISQKFSNIYPRILWFFDIYSDFLIEKSQFTEIHKNNKSEEKNKNKKFDVLNLSGSYCFLIRENLNIVSAEHSSYLFFSLFYSDIFRFFAKIFRRPRFLRIKILKLFFREKINDLKINLEKNIWIKILKNKKISILPSFRHGWGIFSFFNFPIMTILSEYRGEGVKIFELNEKELFYRIMEKDLFFFRINRNKIIDATFEGNLGRLINHSCMANCFSRTIEHGGKDHVVVIIQRKIKVHEEFLYDYRINSDNFDFGQIICKCESFYCRRKLSL